MAIRCPKCNSDNTDTARFCSNCASPLRDIRRPGLSATRTLAGSGHEEAPGSIVAGKYRTAEEVGRGGMGIVYRAQDIKLNRTVALKFLPREWTSYPEVRERFLQEARAVSALDHPNIYPVYEIGETDDRRMFIAMGYYDGESLLKSVA